MKAESTGFFLGFFLTCLSSCLVLLPLLFAGVLREIKEKIRGEKTE